MKPHAYINSDPAGFDPNCAICGGKHRDCIHGATEEERTSRAVFEAQKARDRKHHEDRIVWLSGPCPIYADGARVALVDVINWLKESRACLADTSGMRGYNTGPGGLDP